MPSATSSTRPRVFSSTPTESASWRDRPVARAETPPARSFDAAATTSTTRISPPLPRSRSRKSVVAPGRTRYSGSRSRPTQRRDADRPAGERRERGAREEDAERERAEDVVQARLVRRERRSGEARADDEGREPPRQAHRAVQALPAVGQAGEHGEHEHEPDRSARELRHLEPARRAVRGQRERRARSSSARRSPRRSSGRASRSASRPGRGPRGSARAPGTR